MTAHEDGTSNDDESDMSELDLPARWSRPVGLAAAAVLLAGAIGLATTSDAEPLTATSSFAEVVDREPASTLLAADRPPSASDVERVLDGNSSQQVQP